jgi:hypothetical protein|tara:strand:+ start:419 stop:646 length:228 start_codon:yes stop_codon:yes gene_type:complete
MALKGKSMANHCGFCDTRRPVETENYPHGTKIMVLGEDWYEFCEKCGNNPDFSLTNGETGETLTLEQVFTLISED